MFKFTPAPARAWRCMLSGNELLRKKASTDDRNVPCQGQVCFPLRDDIWKVSLLSLLSHTTYIHTAFLENGKCPYKDDRIMLGREQLTKAESNGWTKEQSFMLSLIALFLKMNTKYVSTYRFRAGKESNLRVDKNPRPIRSFCVGQNWSPCPTVDCDWWNSDPFIGVLIPDILNINTHTWVTSMQRQRIFHRPRDYGWSKFRWTRFECDKGNCLEGDEGEWNRAYTKILTIRRAIYNLALKVFARAGTFDLDSDTYMYLDGVVREINNSMNIL